MSKIYQQKQLTLLTRHVFLENAHSFLYISLFLAITQSGETYQYHLEQTIQDKFINIEIWKNNDNIIHSPLHFCSDNYKLNDVC